MKKNYMELNKLKRLELMAKIIKCNGDFTLFCIDVDDVIFNTEPFVQTILESIDHRATKAYREEIASENSEDNRDSMNKSFDILDAILEETPYMDYDYKKDRTVRREYEQINYDKVYQDANLMPGVVENMRNLLSLKNENTFFIFLSHRNPEREGIAKISKLYQLFPEIDAIETLPFHESKGSKKKNSKALYLKEIYALDSLENCILIDNSRSVCIDFRENGGTDIRFMPNGFTNKNTLSDHISRLIELDPYKIQMALSYIRYARLHPEYVDETDISLGEVKDKVKKLK